jgi:hypothetical protein
LEPPLAELAEGEAGAPGLLEHDGKPEGAHGLV